MISLKNQKAITLIALVITVIIMLILAGITLNMLTGENSILKTGQKAAYKHGEEKGMEQIQLVLGEDSVERIEKGEKLTVNRLVEVFREPDKTWVRNVEGQNTNQDETSGILTIINVEGYVYEITIEGGKLEKIECIGTTEGPSIQLINVIEKDTNSISIKVDALNAEDATYIYSYKKDGETSFTKAVESKENTYKYEGLEKETVYVLKVELETKTGETSKTTNVLTGEMPEGTITIENLGWLNGYVSVRISTTSTLQLQYQKNGEKEESWTDIESGAEIGELVHGDKIYARLWDGKNESEHAYVEVQDLTSPTVNELKVETSDITATTVKLTVTATDEESGLAEAETYKYYLDGTYVTTSVTNNYTYEELEPETKYTLGVTATNKAGITSELEIIEITTIEAGISAKDIEKEDIGKTVTNYTMGGQTWEVFYADTSNIYLITKGIVNDPKYSKNNTTGGVSSGTYGSGSALLTDSTRYPAAEKWFSYLNSGNASTSNQMKGAVFMLDSTGVWDTTYKHTEYADYAIGGPTKELLAASLNKGKGTNYSGDYYNESGYTSGGYDLGSSTVWMHGNSYWLACPQYASSYMVYADHSFNDTSYEAYDLSYSWIGFRPVVCLNSTVKLEVNADGTTLSIIVEE